MTKTFHPYLFAAFVPLQLFLSNGSQFSASSEVSVYFFCGLPIVLTGIVHLLFRKAWKETLLPFCISVFWTVFFTYGHLLLWLYTIGLNQHRYSLAIYSVSVAFIFVAIRFFGIQSQKLNRFFNGVAASLYLVAILPAFVSFLSDQKSVEVVKHTSQVQAKLSNRPDVYYIVLDGFPGAPALNEFYDFDLSPLHGSLQDIGFRVLPESYSNYSRTTLSIPSVLNMEYAHMPPYLENATPKGAAKIDIRRDFRVADLFQEQGYQLYTLTPWWPFSGIQRDNEKSQCENFSIFTPYTETLVRTSMLSLVEGRLAHNSKWLDFLSPGKSVREKHRKAIECLFEEVTTVSKKNTPKFVFAHLITPHPPFVFGDVIGKSYMNTDLPGADKENVRHNFLEQVKHLSKAVPSMVSKIIENSAQPPIIILQSDHGTGFMTMKGHPPTEPVTKNMALEKMNILNAVYGPKELLARFAQPTSAVNTFRTLFSHLSDSRYPPLPDRVFLTTEPKKGIFFEVTDHLFPPRLAQKTQRR